MKTLEQKVMSHVRRIYYLRKLTGRTAIKLYSALALIALLASTVSVSNVLANMPSLRAPIDAMLFLVHASMTTELSVQLIIAALGVVLVLMVRDMFHSEFKHTRGIVGTA